MVEPKTFYSPNLCENQKNIQRKELQRHPVGVPGFCFPKIQAVVGKCELLVWNIEELREKEGKEKHEKKG